MKHLLVLAFLAVAVTDNRVNAQDGWFVPQTDGTLIWMDTIAAANYLEMVSQTEILLDINPVNLYLYTKSNPTVAQKITPTTQSIDASNFNAANPTKITIHGWTRSKDDYVNWGVRDAWLSHGDCNVISVDWARARSVEYASSVLAVPGVGKQIAAFVEFLVQNYFVKLNTLEIIGHSLGAHVAGFTGKNIVSGKAGSIIGLDPAYPLYRYDEPDKRLCNTDGDYVQSIQTDGGKLGFLEPIGQGAFYPNGGQTQPGCGIDPAGICAHDRSVTYNVEAVRMNNFASIECNSYTDAVAKSCGSTYSSVRMGAVTNENMVAGDYFVPVNSQSPYGVLNV